MCRFIILSDLNLDRDRIEVSGVKKGTSSNGELFFIVLLVIKHEVYVEPYLDKD